MFGIGIGPTAAENSQYGALTSAGGFATNLGEKDLTASSDFMNAILSGDATKQAQVLAPEISAAKTSAAQTNKTNAEFGTRSGGTAASTAATNDKVHSDITNLIGSLTGNAASTLSSTGANLLNTGINASQAGFSEAGTLHAEKMAQFNDLLSSIGKSVGAVASFAGVPKGVSQDLNAVASIF